MSDPELDELGLAMPEFRVPTREMKAVTVDDFEDEPTTISQRARDPRAGRQPNSAETAVDATHNAVIDELLAADGDRFDRTELVKTVRMDAFDRASVERGGAGVNDAPSWAIDTMLTTQRYAPDVLIAPPRVLTRRWQDGPTSPIPTQQAPQQQPEPAPAAPAPAPAPAEVFDDVPPEPLHSDAVLTLDSESIELEDVVDPKPPPKPATPDKRPTPGRARLNTGPLPHAERTTPPQATADGDDDMSGIVQELLEEKKKPEPKPRKAAPKANDKRINWFADVFSEEYFRTLPKDLSRQTEREVRFIHKALGLQKGARILDLGCGFGRHTIELAQRDYAIAGLDASMPMLQRALAETQRRGLKIKFVHGDMRELSFNAMFDAVFSWQTSFGFFDDRTNVQVAQGIARALKPGGRFLIDVVNRDHIVSSMPTRTWWEGHECVFLEEVEFDNNFSVLHTKRSFIYEDGSPPREFSSFIRLYSLHELRQLLHFAGFRVVEVSGSIHYPGHFLGPTSPRIILLAERVVKEGS